MHNSKELTKALLGDFGYLQQLRAYSLMRRDPPPHLRDEMEIIERCMEAVADKGCRDVLKSVYCRNRSLKETALHLVRPIAWVAVAHAQGVDDFGYHMEWEKGQIRIRHADGLQLILERPNTEMFSPSPLPCRHPEDAEVTAMDCVAAAQHMGAATVE